jgi:hypothetical protein
MTVKTKIMRPTRPESDQLAGFRISPGGDVELLTIAEVDALVKCAIRAGIEAGLRIRRTLH